MRDVETAPTATFGKRHLKLAIYPLLSAQSPLNVDETAQSRQMTVLPGGGSLARAR